MSRLPHHPPNLITLFLISLIIRLIVAWSQEHPHTMDEAYYYVNAVTLAKGAGLQENFMWHYLNPPEKLPQPSHLYWMPLSSFLAWIGLKIGGYSYGQGQAAFIFLSALLPALGYSLTWQVTQNTRHAWIVGFLLIFSGFYFPVWTVVDGFTPFALAGLCCLYAAWRMLEETRLTWALLAGSMAGLAHLTRADGLLLLGLIILFSLLRTKSNLTAHESAGVSCIQRRGKNLLALKLYLLSFILLGYLLIMAPWFGRNWLTIGSLLPLGGLQTIWLRSYNDLFSYGQNLSWQTYLAWGWAAIWQSKQGAMWLNFQTLIAVPGLIFLFPLAILGWWQYRHHLLFQLAGTYTLALWMSMTFIFTYPGVRGALFHSGGVIFPFMGMAGLAGLDRLIEAIARHRSSWQAEQAKIVFSVGSVGLAILLSVFIYAQDLLTFNPIHQVYPLIAKRLQDPPQPVMLNNPPLYIYYSDEPSFLKAHALPVPNTSIETTLTIAKRYNATHLVLDTHYPPPLAKYFSPAPPEIGTYVHPQLVLTAVYTGPIYVYRILP